MLFNVVQFFLDGTQEYVRRNVLAEQAMDAAKHYTSSVGAKMGTTVKVMITDQDDCCCFEWKFGKGITFM